MATVAVICVGLTKATFDTLTADGPVICNCNLLKPGPPASFPGSKNSDWLTETPLIVIVLASQEGVDVSIGIGGGGAFSCVALTPQAFPVGTNSVNVHMVMSSVGSTTVCV